MLHNLICHILLTAIRPRPEELELVKLLTQATHVLHYTQDWDAHLDPSSRRVSKTWCGGQVCVVSDAVHQCCGDRLQQLEAAYRGVQWQLYPVVIVARSKEALQVCCHQNNPGSSFQGVQEH